MTHNDDASRELRARAAERCDDVMRIARRHADAADARTMRLALSAALHVGDRELADALTRALVWRLRELRAVRRPPP